MLHQRMHLKRFSAHTSEVRSALSRLEGQKSSEIVSDSARQAREAIDQWEAAATALIGSDLQTAIPAPHKLARLRADVHSGLRSVAESVKIETANSIALIKSSTNAAIYLAILSAIAAFGIGIAASVSTGLSLTRPLARVQQRMKDLMAAMSRVTSRMWNCRTKLARWRAQCKCSKPRPWNARRLTESRSCYLSSPNGCSPASR